MAGLLYVRTGGGGSNPAFMIDDLGFEVPTGAGWTLLAASSPPDPEGSAGQFTAREVRDSNDLYTAITTGQLEWSKDGVSNSGASDYVSDFMLMQDFTDDFLDLSNGRLRLPQAADIPGTLTSGIEEGEIAWDTDDDVIWVWNGTQWVTASSTLDHGLLQGLDDDDHPQYGHLAQDETVSGMWTFAPTTATDPSMVLSPRGAAPTTNVADGALAIVDGILYAYDATRSKWLSVDRQKFMTARKGNATNIYMRVPDGVATSETGVRMLRDGTIVGLFAQTDGSETWTFEIRRLGVAIATLAIAAASGDQDDTVNIDVSQGDEIQFFCNGTAVRSPVGGMEIAWRV